MGRRQKAAPPDDPSSGGIEKAFGSCGSMIGLVLALYVLYQVGTFLWGLIVNSF